MLCLDLLTRGAHHRLLVVYGETGALVWDVRCPPRRHWIDLLHCIITCHSATCIDRPFVSCFHFLLLQWQNDLNWRDIDVASVLMQACSGTLAAVTCQIG